jgi:hypothetical protein
MRNTDKLREALEELRRWQNNGGTKAGYEYIDRAISSLEALVASKPEPSKCAQCKREYRHSASGKGCPKCAPGVSIPESEFQKPLQAQAAEPEVFAVAIKRISPDGRSVVKIEHKEGKLLTPGMQFITLQAHREAMAKAAYNADSYKNAWLASYEFAKQQEDAIAKKDAALDACEKDATRYRWICQQDHEDRQSTESFEEFKAARDKAIDVAITKAQECRK